MAFTDRQLKTYEAQVAQYVETKRPREEIRDQLDIAYRIEGQSVVIFEIRPRFQHPDQKVEEPVAKATYVATRRRWRVFWMRADCKWHAYPPKPTVRSLAAFLRLVEDDPHCCFWG